MDAMKQRLDWRFLGQSTRHLTALLLAFIALTEGKASAAPPTPGSASSDGSREVVVTGEVVETACFVMAGRKGSLHRQCATACARAGQPLGILEDGTGTLHVAVFDRTESTPDNPLVALIADRVEVRGTAIERGGVSAIAVKRVRSLSPPRQDTR
jgi:hypothetical protein